MAPLRSVLGFLLAAVAILIVSCGGTNIAVPTTYTETQIAEIQIYAPSVTQLRERFPELEDYIQKKNWVNISSFIHGPLGELRARLGRVAVRLLPQDATQAKALANDLVLHLEKLDAATEGYDQIEAGRQYRLALDDFDAFLSLVPDGDA